MIDKMVHSSNFNLLTAVDLIPVQDFVQLSVEFLEGLRVKTVQVDLSSPSSHLLVALAAALLDHVDYYPQLLLGQLLQSLVETVLLGLGDLLYLRLDSVNVGSDLFDWLFVQHGREDRLVSCYGMGSSSIQFGLGFGGGWRRYGLLGLVLGLGLTGGAAQGFYIDEMLLGTMTCILGKQFLIIFLKDLSILSAMTQQGPSGLQSLQLSQISSI